MLQACMLQALPLGHRPHLHSRTGMQLFCPQSGWPCLPFPVTGSGLLLLLCKPRMRWREQVLGAVLGALLEVALVPGLHWGRHSGAPVPGCFPPPPPTLNNFQILGWTTCAHASHACWSIHA